MNRRRLSGFSVVSLIGALVAALLAMPGAAAAAVPSPTGLTPNGGSVNGIPTLTWNRVSGATSYEVQTSTTSDFAKVTKYTTTNRRVVPSSPLPSGANHWRVRALVAKTAGEWSESSFGVSAASGPALVTPGEGATLFQPDDPVYLSWSPIAGAATYAVEVDDSPDFLSPVVKTGLKVTSMIMDNPQVATEYFWRVKAVFAAGIETRWSTEGSFKIGGMSKPTLVSPANNPTRAIDDVKLTWNKVRSATKYELQVSTADSFASTVVSTTVVGTTYSPSITLRNDQYYWRVRPVDVFGNKLDWNAVDTWQFKRAWSDQPMLQYPTNGSIMGDPIFFQWSGAKLASSYRLQVSSNSLFTGATTQTCTTRGTTYTPKRAGDCWPAGFGTYYWRVIASDGPLKNPTLDTEVDHAHVNQFSYAPAVVDLAGMVPAHAAEIPANEVGFRWNPVAGAAKYRVTVAAIDGGKGAFIRDTTTTSISPIVAFEPGKSYRWQVQTVSESGRLGSSLIASAQNTFTATETTSAESLTPTPVSPATGAASSRFPQLRWTAVQDAAYYKVQVRDAAGIAAFVELADKFTAVNGTHSTSTNLPGTFQWRVQAYDEDGATLGDPGPARTFTISSPGTVPGARAAITGQASGGTATSCTSVLPARCEDLRQTPVLRWDPVVNAGSYKLWISKDARFTNIVRDANDLLYNGIKVEGTMFSPLAALPDSQASDAYYWRVVPCTIGDACTPRTDADRAFNKKSNAVELLTPANGSSGPDTVTFTWRDYLETNLLPGKADVTGVNARTEALQYRIQVSSVPNFQTLIDDQVVDQRTYTSFTKTYPEGLLYWRVAAIDGSENLLTYSAPRTFVKATPAPVIKKVNSGAPVTQAVPFQWEPTAHAALYQAEIFKNNDTIGSSGNKVATITGKQSAVALTDVLSPNEQYRWRVRMRDTSNNWGPFSSLAAPDAAFVVSSAQAPTQASPASGVTLGGHDALFAWTGVPTASNYRFEARLAGQSSPTTVTTKALAHAPLKTLAAGQWQWRVVALNSTSNVIGASPWRGFAVKGTSPVAAPTPKPKPAPAPKPVVKRDTKRPTVKSVAPKNRAKKVKRSSNIKIRFSEPITRANASTIKLYRAGSKRPIKVKITLNRTRTVVTVNPRPKLAKSKRHTLKISSLVVDRSGNRMSKARNFSFTTGKK